MKAHARLIAALVLALVAAAGAHGQSRERGGGGRGEGRRESAPPRYEERRAPEPRPAYGAPAPAYGYRPYGAPAYAPSYAPPPRYAPQPRYPLQPGYAPRPGYAPNSLGADWGQQQDQARRGVRQGGLMPLHNVMSMIGNRIPGRLLDAGIEPGPEGRPAYRVRWAAKGGRRIDLIVDAATGAILSRSGD